MATMNDYYNGMLRVLRSKSGGGSTPTPEPTPTPSGGTMKIMHKSEEATIYYLETDNTFTVSISVPFSTNDSDLLTPGIGAMEMVMLKESSPLVTPIVLTNTDDATDIKYVKGTFTNTAISSTGEQKLFLQQPTIAKAYMSGSIMGSNAHIVDDLSNEPETGIPAYLTFTTRQNIDNNLWDVYVSYSRFDPETTTLKDYKGKVVSDSVTEAMAIGQLLQILLPDASVLKNCTANYSLYGQEETV